MNSYLSRIIWIVLGIITLLTRYSVSAEDVEIYYSRGIFLWVRTGIDVLLGWSPIPLIYVFFGILLFLLFRTLQKVQWRTLITWNGLLNALLSTFAFLGGTLFLFFLLWGFNYGRIPFVQQANLHLQPVPVDALFQNLEITTDKAQLLRHQISTQSNPLNGQNMPADLEEIVRPLVQETLTELNYPAVGKVRGRLLQPKGIFLRFSTAGLYWPFVGEGNIDSGLHPIQQPFTLAHELAHGYGITNEGVCNFIAYLACQKATDPFIQYSGVVTYWRYLAVAYQRFKKEDYWAFRNQLPEALQSDMDAINQNLNQYPDILPRFRNFAYDQYLKSQGISEGMASYSQIIMLVAAWEKQQSN